MMLHGEKLKFFDSLLGKIVEFVPIKNDFVGMYVCGPTVYSRPHLGNARSFVFYDVVFRVLKNIYKDVKYVRNITDVDDKIIAESKKTGEDISLITKRVINEFHKDARDLFCLSPTIEPLATDNIDQMCKMIKKLIENGFAYEKNRHILFDVSKFDKYCCLSKKNKNELIAGARIEIADYKNSSEDFVLWKPADAEKKECGFDSIFGFGRPGWHIECSAMSEKYLSQEFDIHGGGADLKFPHHDNEIAQSVCSSGKNFAKYWIHNGFLTVEGEKMSKSLGNFTTPRDLLNDGVDGEVLRFALLSTLYSKPMDFSKKLISDAKISMLKFYEVLSEFDGSLEVVDMGKVAKDAILNNFNLPKYIAIMHSLIHDIRYNNNSLSKKTDANKLYSMGRLIGLFNSNFSDFIEKNSKIEVPEKIIEMAKKRSKAKCEKDFAKADEIRLEIKKNGFDVKDLPNFEFEIFII